MVLGAGWNQVPMIRAAVEAGHRVVTVDNIPDNVGHRYAHEAVDCSTVDRAAVLEAAERSVIDGITTCASDVATPTVGYVAEALGLAGPSHDVAIRMSNKALFRSFQRAAGLPVPGFCLGDAFEEIEEPLTALSPPLVFKPVDTSGSRGVGRVDELDRDHLRAAFAEAKRYSRSGEVCVEEFVHGHDVSGDGLLIQGVVHAAVTQKHKIGLVPLGHRLPTHLSSTEQRAVLGAVTSACAAIGYRDGPIDFDAKVSASGATVLEMSPRLGGNAIPGLIRCATGVDLFDAAIDYALGRLPSMPDELTVVRPCASLVLSSPLAGIVSHVASAREIQQAVPEILDCSISVEAGDEVRTFVHSANAIGHVIFTCPRPEDFEVVADRVRRALTLTVAHGGTLEETTSEVR